VKFDDAMVEALSAQRHIDLVHAPLMVGYEERAALTLAR